MSILEDRSRASRDAELQLADALGGTVRTTEDLPFRESEDRGVPAPVYVRHDPEMLRNVARWLGDFHVGLISPLGSGKTTIREVVRREFSDRFVIAQLGRDNSKTTERNLYATLVRAGLDAGYELDASRYGQLREGVPWSTKEAQLAVEEMVETVRADGRELVFIADQLESFPEHLYDPLQAVGDQGVRLLVMGRPEGRETLRTAAPALYSRINFHEQEIRPFETDHVAEYVDRWFHYLRGEPYERDDPAPELFTEEACRAVVEATGGNPRLVRRVCQRAFSRAADAFVAGTPLSDLSVDAADVRAVTGEVSTDQAAVAAADTEPDSE
jgi:hypothetical protein